MKRALTFGRLFLFQPARAAEECLRPDALSDGLRVYAVWVVASLLYLWLKPFDFPDVNAPIAARVQGLAFWSKVAVWEPVLAALNIALTGLILRWMRDGWLPLKTAAATLWCTLPLILTVAYTRSAISKAVFAVLFILWAVPGILYARRIPGPEWRRTTAFLLGLNAVGLLMLAAQAAAMIVRSDMLYKGSLVLTVVWLLACGGIGLRNLAKTSLPRSVLAFLFASLVLNLVLAAAFLLGWLPMEVLKVLIYV
ncbi:MAG: hypothetical protein AAB262_01230 [Elusimicrobiota bacterium]